MDPRALLREYLGASTSVEATKSVLLSHPELLDPSVDLMLARMAQAFRSDGDARSAQLVEGRRQLLDECRRLGVHGALVKFEAYTKVRGFLDITDPDGKLRYVQDHPELLEFVHQVVLHQLIDSAREAGDQDAVRFFESHLWLLVMSEMESPQWAFERAFGSRLRRRGRR